MGAGASGSFFFFTADKRFIMKTMPMREVHHLLRVLPSYVEHLEKNADKSYLAKYYGIFTISMAKFTPLSVLIMENTLPNIDHADLQFTFDMKGSQINREVLKKKSARDLRVDQPTGGKVLKDLDFLRLKELKKFINFHNDDWSTIISNISRDVSYLQSQRFMDYSLLMAIRKIGDGGDEVRGDAESHGHFDIQRSATYSKRQLDENYNKIRAKYSSSVKSMRSETNPGHSLNADS